MITEFVEDTLKVRIYKTRNSMGQDAALMVGSKIEALLKEKSEVNMVFASAPSQSEFLESLRQDKRIDWSRINAFHMDEYIGLDPEAPQRFGNFLQQNLFQYVPIKNVYFINGSADNVEDECDRYASLLRENPVDIVCLGIGENTHIAFNDPHVADFNDPKLVKIVDLDDKSRQQQVNDKCFEKFEDVPTHAITLTISALIGANHLFCMVPGKNKAEAVYKTLNSEISSIYPSTILRSHPDSILFVDADSSIKILTSTSTKTADL